MTARCREGHESTELDYCSVCGTQMPPAGAPARGRGVPPTAPHGSESGAAHAPAPAHASGASVCPSCGEPRAGDDARFCEVCRYDFVSGQPGKLVAKAPSVAPARPASAPAPAPAPAPHASTFPVTWQLVVMVDATLDIDPDPSAPCPKDKPIEMIPVDRDELLVGRHDDVRDIRPDIPLGDPGASRRHAKFVRSADGSVALQDLASTNGSTVNGKDVVPGSRSPLKNGDEVTIGRWTRIKLRSVP